MAGGSVVLFCLHSGSLPAADISWSKDYNTISANGRITINTEVLTHTDPPQTTSSISILPLKEGDSGSYDCVATNSLLPNSPIHSSAAILTVLG